MLMKTRIVDFHHVADEQLEIHARLKNWESWVKPRSLPWVSPMFRQARSNSRQWHQPEIRATCDILGAMRMERAIYHLPEMHRTAIRWYYVYPVSPIRVCKTLGVSMESLALLVRDGRRMLMNRGM